MNEERRIVPTGQTPTAAEGGLAMAELEELTPEQLGGEIRLLTTQARKIVLSYAIEIGHRLVLAKEKVAHGEWIDWVARETTLSQSNANRMMRLYEEYGARQECFFGAELNSSTLANLSVSNALALLAFPAEEREQAAVELDAEHLSTRELAEAIAARKEAEEKLKGAEERVEALSRDLDEAEEQIREAEEKARRASDNENELLRKLSEAKKDVLAADEMAEKNERELKARIKELEERPIEVAVEKDEAAIEEAAREARAEAEAEAEKKISALQKKLEKAEDARDRLKDAAGKAESGAAEKIAAAEKDAAAARQELEAMRKQLAASDKDVTEFILHSKAVQRSFADMFDALDRIAARDVATAQKLNAGVISLLRKFADRCNGLEKAEQTSVLDGQSELGG